MKVSLPLLAALLAVPLTALAQHGHLNVGATGLNQNDKLIWANGSIFASTSGFVRTMIYTNAGRFSNSYNQNISLTALPRTIDNGGPVDSAPALGAFVLAEIVSVSGPEGGSFQLWETNSPDGQPGLSVPVGTANGSFRFDLSDKHRGAGTVDGDPFGHIHSRRMAVTKPGLYKVGFRAVDVSTNGENGGPIHQPSDVLEINFEGLLSFTTFAKAGELMRLSFKAEGEYHYEVQYADDANASAAEWRSANVSVSHESGFKELEVPNATGDKRFYRIKAEREDH